jgi:hypothetical protein
MTLTQAQINDIQALTANIETSSRALQRSKTALSYLIQLGQAMCTDVRSYNLMVKSTYLYQKSIADIIRASGSTAPDIPAPVYVAYKGIGGEAAINIDCNQAGTRGWFPNGLGDFYVKPQDVEWRQAATPDDIQTIARVTSAAAGLAKPTGELGNPLLVIAVPIILWGIVISVAGYVILKIVEALTDVPGKREYTRQVAISAERHAAVMEARQKCLLDCLHRGKSHDECAKNCARLNPAFSAPSPFGQIGIVGKIMLGVLGLGVLYAGYRIWDYYYGGGGGGGDSGRALPAGGDDDLDGADESDGFGGVSRMIDADYTER